MDDLQKLKESLLQDNQNLNNQKNTYLDNFININLESNILTQINEDLIIYFKNNINNLNLTNEEFTSINKSFNYFTSVNNLGIDLSNLYFEDNNLIHLKENIIIIYKKMLEYKELIVSQLDFKINSNNTILENINLIEKIVNCNNIDLDKIHDLINLLPIKDKLKISIYRDVYLCYIKKLKNNEQNFERDASDLLEKIILGTEPSPEIERRIEEQGIKLEITDDDKELQVLIQGLLFNIRKLDSKFPTDIYKQSNDEFVQRNKKLLQTDRIKLNDLLIKVEELYKKLESYFKDKDIVWETEFEEEELKKELESIYSEIKNQYNKYNSIYESIFENYKKRINNNTEEFKTDDHDFDQNPPIIFWFGNNQVVNEDNYEKVEEFLQEFDAYPEDNFYSDDLLPVLTMLKQQLSFVKFKEQGFAVNTINEVQGVRSAIPFKEIKMRHGGTGGTARIYYDTIKSVNGKNFIIIYLINNKTEAYDKESYQQVQRYLKSKLYQGNLCELLDDEEIIEKFKNLEKYVFEKVKERVMTHDQKIGIESITNGGTK